MREICTLRARWRGLETELRTSLHGHKGGNPGYGQGMPYGPPRQSPTLPEAYGPWWIKNRRPRGRKRLAR